MTLRQLFIVLLIGLASTVGRTNEIEATERASLARRAAELRESYAKSTEYNPYDRTYTDHTEAAAKAQKSGDLAKAIEEIQNGLKYSKYDIEMLMFLSALYEEKGDLDKAKETRVLWTSLLDSIFDSGSGRDFATAFRVINVSEEYAVIRILRLKVLKQSLRGHEGSMFDVFEVENPRNGQSFELFFNIDLPKKWLNRQLGANSGK